MQALQSAAMPAASAARSALQAGQPTEFGAVGARPEGIACADELLPWGQLAAVGGRACKIVGPFARLQAGRVNDLYVLLALVREKLDGSLLYGVSSLGTGSGIGNTGLSSRCLPLSVSFSGVFCSASLLSGAKEV